MASDDNNNSNNPHNPWNNGKPNDDPPAAQAESLFAQTLRARARASSTSEADRSNSTRELLQRIQTLPGFTEMRRDRSLVEILDDALVLLQRDRSSSASTLPSNSTSRSNPNHRGGRPMDPPDSNLSNGKQ